MQWACSTECLTRVFFRVARRRVSVQRSPAPECAYLAPPQKKWVISKLQRIFKRLRVYSGQRSSDGVYELGQWQMGQPWICTIQRNTRGEQARNRKFRNPISGQSEGRWTEEVEDESLKISLVLAGSWVTQWGFCAKKTCNDWIRRNDVSKGNCIVTSGR